MSIDTHRTEIDLSGRVAEEIRALLARRRMSGRELARVLGVSPSWVSYRLTGSQPIDINDLDRIADALQVGIVDLLPRERRSPTLTLAPTSTAVEPAAPGWSIPRQRQPVVSGTHPHPGHPVLAGAVPLPRAEPRRISPTGR